MKSFRSKLIVLVAAAGLLLGAAQPVLAAVPGAGACWTPVEVNSAIAKGTIQPWAKVKKLAGIADDWRDKSVKVCLMGGQPYYVVNMVSPAGAYQTFVKNAVDGTS